MSTSAHCIGNAYEIIQMGKQDRIFAGGGEELDWTLSALFDAMPLYLQNIMINPQNLPELLINIVMVLLLLVEVG